MKTVPARTLGRNGRPVNQVTIADKDLFAVWLKMLMVPQNSHGPLRLPAMAPTSGSYFDFKAGG